MTYAPVVTSNGLGGYSFTRKYIIYIYNVAQYSLHYVTNAPAKFEVATSNSLREDAFTRKSII